MKKTGLADSPFFTTQLKKKTVTAPPSRKPVTKKSSQKGGYPVPPVSPVQDVPPVEEVQGVRPIKRKIKHHPFSIYEDQLETLRKMKLEAMLKGIDRSIASMVRDALDQFIKNN